MGFFGWKFTLFASDVGVADKSGLACANHCSQWQRIDHRANGMRATWPCLRARVFAHVIETCQFAGTVCVHRALWCRFRLNYKCGRISNCEFSPSGLRSVYTYSECILCRHRQRSQANICRSRHDCQRGTARLAHNCMGPDIAR